MQVAARTGAWIGKALPYDAEVEWLEAGGSHWMDSGIDTTIAQYNFILKYSFSRNWDRATPKAFMGYWSPMSGCQIVSVYSGQFSYGIKVNGSSNTITLRRPSPEVVYTDSFENSDNDGLRFILFARDDNGKIDIPCKYFRLHSLVVKNKDTLEVVKQYKPVRVGSVGALYESICGDLIFGSGTGAFIIGPDKVSTEGGGY